MTHVDLPDVDCHFCGTPLVREGKTVVPCTVVGTAARAVLCCLPCGVAVNPTPELEAVYRESLVKQVAKAKREYAERLEFERWMAEAWEAGE